MKRVLVLLVVSLLAGCTTVAVVDSSGAPVAGAEVFLNDKPQGSTDAAGRLVFSPRLPIGATLFARHRVYEHQSWRPDHGLGLGWVMRVYQTSRIVNDSGFVTDLTVTDPKAIQTLTVRPENAMLGWHLVASLDWDASDDELNQLVTRFNDASQYLYNLTDGQFVIEQVEIADDAQLWGSAEIAFQVDTWVWPHTNFIGGFLGRSGAVESHIYMAPFSVSDPRNGSTDHRTLVHELGHLALALQDEYVGFNFQNYCTDARHNGTAPPFGAGQPLAACAMDSQFQSSKLCSAHNDSAHRGGTWQPGPCWNTVADGYKDPGPGAPRWIVRTPSMRGAVVGTLPPLPVGLKPKITPMNRVYHDLCKPILFVDPAGASAAGGTVWVQPTFWGGGKGSYFTVGRLDSTGSLVVSGVHLGDTIKSRSTLIVDSTKCTVTQ